MNYGATKAQLASYIVHPTVGMPCPDCAPPPGSVTEVIRCILDFGLISTKLHAFPSHFPFWCLFFRLMLIGE